MQDKQRNRMKQQSQAQRVDSFGALLGGVFPLPAGGVFSDLLRAIDEAERKGGAERPPR